MKLSSTPHEVAQLAGPDGMIMNPVMTGSAKGHPIKRIAEQAPVSSSAMVHVPAGQLAAGTPDLTERMQLQKVSAQGVVTRHLC